MKMKLRMSCFQVAYKVFAVKLITDKGPKVTMGLADSASETKDKIH